VAVERGSDKHGHRLDEEMKHEVEGLVRSGHSTHAQEWADPEPSGEDEPEVDRAPNGALSGGVPEGMSPEEVEARSDLARYLPPAAFPADAEALRTYAAAAEAPAPVIQQLGRAPEGKQFASVGELWTALGGGSEEHRF
jgi:hypothetical protein